MKRPWTKVVLRAWEQFVALRVTEPFCRDVSVSSLGVLSCLGPPSGFPASNSCVVCML